MYAYEQSEKYKEGKFIIEREYMIKVPTQTQTEEGDDMECDEEKYYEEIIQDGNTTRRVRTLIGPGDKFNPEEDDLEFNTDRSTARNTLIS